MATTAPTTTTGSTIPWLGVVAVLFGAIATTLANRLTSQGLADIRGAIGAGFDEGSWITTAFGAAQMFIAIPAVWLGRTYSPRKVLLVGCVVFGVSECLIPAASSLSEVIVLQTTAGLGSGTFIPLTPPFIFSSLPLRLRPWGIAAYAMNIVFGLNIAATLEGWYLDHATWQWIFWQNAVVAAPLFALYYFGIPRTQPNEQFENAATYLSLSALSIGLTLIFIVLDQGDRVDWFASNMIVELALAGAAFIGLFLFVAAELETSDRHRFHFSILGQRNAVLLALIIVCARFLISSTNIVVPAFLAQAQGLRPLQIGESLLWIALPQLVVAPIVAWFVGKTDARVVVVIGMVTVCVAFILGAQLTSVWAEPDFVLPLLMQAGGQTLALTATVYLFSLQISATDALSYGSLIQISRVFGGEVGIGALTVFIRKCEQSASNNLGIHAGAGMPAVLERLAQYGSAVVAKTQGADTAGERAVALLAGSIRNQAYTLAFADAFWLGAAVAAVAACLAFCLQRPSSG
jgi:MFS transporter, DHA2 family, multidrug resistance protein